MPAFGDNGLAHFDCATDDRLQRDCLTMQFDTALFDTREIEHVVNQSRHGAPLPMNDTRSPRLLRRRDTFANKQLSRRTQGREWIAKLMTQHGQKLVLVPVG